MKAKAIAFSAFLLVSVSLFSQENETEETIKYSNITEGGMFTASPRSIGFEAVTVNGFSINQQHCLGLGIGFGYVFGFSSDSYFLLHMPVFVNYRLYLKPDKAFSPHINVALGGSMASDLSEGDGFGIYSSITAGFKAYKFSFASGLSFMAIKGEREVGYYNDAGWWATTSTPTWYYPFGVTVKCGFTF